MEWLSPTPGHRIPSSLLPASAAEQPPVWEPDELKSSSRSPRDDWFRGMYARNVDYTRKLVRRFGLLTDEVDDAVQDTFLVFYRRWQRIDDPREVRRVLRAVAVYVCRNHKRSRWRSSLRWSSAVPADPDTVVDSRTSPPDVLAASNRTRESVVRAIRNLCDEHREVLILAVLLQLKPVEVAKRVQLPAHRLAYRLRRARQALARELAKGSLRPVSDSLFPDF